jgi:hypothetical protein
MHAPIVSSAARQVASCVACAPAVTARVVRGVGIALVALALATALRGYPLLRKGNDEP